MQPGEEIKNLLDEIEAIVEEGRSPLTGGADKKIVNAQDIYERLDEINRVFPNEFEKARRIVSEEQSILDNARKTADSIIADAQQQAAILAGDQEVVRIAKQESDEIRSQAMQYQRDMHYSMNQYAEGVITSIEDNLKTMIGQLERNRQALSDEGKQRH